MARRPQRNGLDAVSVSITFDGDEGQLLRQFMVDENVPNANTAVRMMVASALHSDRKWWAVVSAQRKSMMWEFRRAVYTEFLKKLRELNQSVKDDIALFNQQDPSYGRNPDQA